MDKNYIEGYEAGLRTAATKYRKQEQEIRRILEGTVWGRLSNFFKKKQKKFEIKIVYQKNDMDFAEKLRQILTAQGHSAYAMTVDQFRFLPSNTADYTIYINDCDKIDRKKENIISNKFGCFISAQKTQIIVSCDDKVLDNSNINNFIKFYNETLSLKKESEKYNVKIENNTENFSASSFERMIDKILQTADDIEKKHSSGLALLYLTSRIPQVFIGFGIVIPSVICEELFKDLSSKLKSHMHRKKYIPLCQQQIVEILLCSYLTT